LADDSSRHLVPRIVWSRDYLATFVAILGTTISPYLFFWQAAQEVEEERRQGRRSVGQRKGATDAELRRSFIDVATGMFFSNFVMYFIILTTAITLHAHGQTRIATAQEAAQALRPLAGDAAYWLFTLGIVGTGMLAVPVLAGSCAYAIGEALAWRVTLSDRPRHAWKFYAVIAAAMLIGLALDAFGSMRSPCCSGRRSSTASSPATHRGGGAPDQRSVGHGRAHQPAPPAVAGLDDGRGDDGRHGGDVLDVVNGTDATRADRFVSWRPSPRAASAAGWRPARACAGGRRWA